MAQNPTSPGPVAPRDLRRHDFTDGTPPADGLRHTEELLPSRTYPSSLLWRLTRALNAGAPPGRVLDLGPTVDANIQFWGSRGFEITCYDLFAHESRSLARERVTPMTLSGERMRQRGLPFDDGSFSAICAWNVFGRLPFVLAQRYARECHRLLARSGLLHAIFLDVPGRIDVRRRYQIHDRQTIEVSSSAIPPKLPTTWIDAEVRFLLSRFAACEIQPSGCSTREVLAQRAPGTPMPA